MTLALYRKWRPMTWDEVIGQEHVTRTLRNALKSERIAHAYLFTGSRGTGKTTSARLVAKAVNCLAADPAARPCNACAHCLAVNEARFLDIVEIDAASNNGVEDVRDLREKVNFAPNQGRYRVYIIDEVHMLSAAAFNALLKTLEEPPAHVIFILATTEVHKLPATITSRCQRFDFRRISVAEMTERLAHIAAQEGLQAEPAALEVIARQATGSLRDAVSLMDQLLAAPDEPLTLAHAQAALGTAAGQAVQDLAAALAEGDTGRGLTLINAAIDDGADPRQFARQMVDYLRGLLLVRMGNAALVDAARETRDSMARQASQFEIAYLLRAIRAFNGAAADQRGGWQAQLPLELAFVECALPAPQPEARAANAPVAPVPADPAPARPAQAAVAPPPRPRPAPQPPARPQPAPAPATPAPPAAPGGDPTPAATLAEVKRRWPQVKAAARRQHPAAHGLLNSCRPVKVEGEVLILATNAAIVQEKLGDAANREKIERALSEALGGNWRYRCVLAGAASSSEPAADMADDGVLATALRDLGGKLKDA